MRVLVVGAGVLGIPAPALRLARCHVPAYEARRARERAAA
jgi:hypothetical protein